MKMLPQKPISYLYINRTNDNHQVQSLLSIVFLIFLVNTGNVFANVDSVSELYIKHCAVCHGLDRLGGQGPALLPENLHRLRQKKAVTVIAKGRPATQMLPFETLLNPQQIQSLVKYIYTPLKQKPVWGVEQIKTSHIIHNEPGSLPDKPKFDADIDNLFIVVELGDHHASLLNGDTFERIHRFPTRFALHGGPKYAKGGRYVYFASRDGWISKFDVFNLTYVAEIRAGINARNIAVSHDGKYVIVANYLPNTLVILDAEDLSLIKVIPVQDESGKSSRVSAVYTADPRGSFIAALKDIAEVWEINYENPPPTGFGEWIHDYKEDSGEGGSNKLFPVRKISVKGYLDDFFINQDYTQIAGTSREGLGQIVDLDLGRAVSALELPGMPHLSSGISWKYQGKTVLATPNIKKSTVTIVDTETWNVIKQIPTKGPGFFMRSHENSPYAWVDVFFGKNRDLMHVIDKQTLEIVKTLRPAPGKTSAHVEFTKDGRYALVSIWDMDGALVIYDAKTLEEVKRIPMKKPSGKYNVHNKLTRSAGTSH
jgi:DNA-binding beta-propeller fold protein YncE